MKTQVAIIGGGPAGLLLAQLLDQHGIDSVVLEKHSRAYVLARIRAGLLERGFVELMDQAGCGARLKKQGEIHRGIFIARNDACHRIDLSALTGGRTVTVYGQTEVTRDLYDARAAGGGQVFHDVDNVQLHDITTKTPYVTYDNDAKRQRIDCDFIVGADGFHGVSRHAIPADVSRSFEKVFPFGWLGILTRTPPVSPELIYATHARGFALCTLRSQVLSRYYIQVPNGDTITDWPDARFWDEIMARLPGDVAARLVTGPSIEKSIAPLRSFVTEPMRYGALFLAGDAAHIVPPTGAKGLNTAASDVYYLYHGLRDFYQKGNSTGLDHYSERAVARVWKAQRFSWWMTNLLHRFDGQTDFDRRLQTSDLDYLLSSKAAMTSLAENYVGLPY